MTLRVRLTALFVGAFVWLTPISTHAAAPAREEAIQRLEEELNDAFQRCDAEALGRLWDDDLTFVFPNGRSATKADRIAGLKDCTPGTPMSANESVGVKTYCEVAVAIVLSKWTGTSEGKPFAIRFRATHVWAKRAGEWRLVSAHVSQVKEGS